MLVLSRKIGERLVIGDNITIVVNRIAGNRVTLGIEAPSDVRVVRGELRTFDESELSASSELSESQKVASPAKLAPSFDLGALNGFVPRVAK